MIIMTIVLLLGFTSQQDATGMNLHLIKTLNFEYFDRELPLQVQGQGSELVRGKRILLELGQQSGGDRLPLRERRDRRRAEETHVGLGEKAVLDGADRQAKGGILGG